jgi:DNA-binding NarL/FixJ family response regulator
LVNGNYAGLNVTDRLRILLADDNKAILDAVQRLLQDDFQIVARLDQASAVVRETPILNPDVLILDISMPEMNGFEITYQLKQSKCTSKIIFLTVHEELDFIRAAFEAGASGYVFKSRMNVDLQPAINAVQAGRPFIPGAPIPQ